jgi:acyl carrier protein
MQTQVDSISNSERELAATLIEALNLEDRDAATIDPAAPLFSPHNGGWGLDSIDALEIALAVQQKFGVELRADDDESRKALASLRSLAVYVADRRKP